MKAGGRCRYRTRHLRIDCLITIEIYDPVIFFSFHVWGKRHFTVFAHNIEHVAGMIKINNPVFLSSRQRGFRSSDEDLEFSCAALNTIHETEPALVVDLLNEQDIDTAPGNLPGMDPCGNHLAVVQYQDIPLFKELGYVAERLVRD